MGRRRNASAPEGSECLASLLPRARRGDRPAIAAIYARLAPQVTGYLRGAGARDADDLTGDVFVAVMRGLAAFDGDEDAFRRWIFTIAHHRLVDHCRRRARRLNEAALDDEHDTTVADHSEQVLARVGATPAVRALAQLTAEQRDVVLLRSVADLSVADTASVLGKNPGAVKTLHRRALASLARLVDQEVLS